MEYPNCFVAEIKNVNHPEISPVYVFERKPDFMNVNGFQSEVIAEITLYQETIFSKELKGERFVVSDAMQVDKALFDNICKGSGVINGIEVIDAMRTFCAQIEEYKQKAKEKRYKSAKRGLFSRLFASK